MHPLCDPSLYFIQCVKDFRVQPFLSTCVIEAIVAGVIPGTARMATEGFNLNVHSPIFKPLLPSQAGPCQGLTKTVRGSVCMKT